MALRYKECVAGAGPGIFGRDDELAAVGAFLASSAPGDALLLEGEAGIGKTTVWTAAVEAGIARGDRVLQTRPTTSEASFAYSGIADLLSDDTVAAVVSELPGPQRRALEVALLRDEGTGVLTDRRAVATAFLGVLRALGSVSRVLVCVDDVQWLDSSSRATIAFSARRLGGESVRFVLARRLERGTELLLLEQAFGDARVHRVAIEPLGPHALHRVLLARFPAAIPRPLLCRIHERSGGNPFFALELARALERLEESELPSSLDALVRERLAALPDPTRRALGFAAALSQPTLQLLDLTLDADSYERLAPALDAHVVELDRGAVRFSHPLLAAGAYGLASAKRRREIHRRLGQVLDDPEESARHRALAASRADESVAAALEDAATRAVARGAPAAAAQLGEHAARLTPVERASDARRRLSDAAYRHWESGDTGRARMLFEQLVAELGPGLERANVLTRLALVRQYDDNVEVAIELGRQAAVEAGDDALTRARALDGVSGNLFRSRSRLAEAVSYGKEAVELMRRAGDETHVGRFLASQLIAEATLGREAAVTTLEETLRLVESADNARERVMGSPKVNCAVVLMWWEELPRAADWFHDLADLCRATGDESSLPYVLVLLAQCECYRGNLGVATSHAGEACELAEQVGQETVLAYALAVRALADAHRGHAEDARSGAERALELAARTHGAPAQQFATTALGLLELSLGRPAVAADRLAPLVAFARTEEMCEPGLTRFAFDQVEALVELGRLEKAEELLAWSEGHAVRLRRQGAVANARRGRALLASARGDDALPILEQALALSERSPFPFDRERTRLAYGGALRRAKRKREARTALDQAKAGFERLGADAFAERARDELARISGRAGAHDELTATERRVTELVSQGLTNCEVAATMFVTSKTVEFHLRNIFRKLGIRSRIALVRMRASRDG